jgi:hypothetical protein
MLSSSVLELKWMRKAIVGKRQSEREGKKKKSDRQGYGNERRWRDASEIFP